MAGLEQAPREIPQAVSEAVDLSVVNPTPEHENGNSFKRHLSPEEMEEILTSLELEGYTLAKDVTISGPSYVGKNVIADNLAAILGVEHWDGKDDFERRTGVEKGKGNIDEDMHRRFDNLQFQSFYFSRPNRNRRIKQTRLAGINLGKARDRRDIDIVKRNIKIAQRRQRRKHLPNPIPEIDAVSVLIGASKKTRVDRALNEYCADLGVQKDQLSNAQLLAYRSHVEGLMDERDEDNLMNWRKVHPDYLGNGEDPFDYRLARPNGLPVYDMYYESKDGVTLKDEIRDILERLKEFGAFKPKAEKRTGGTVFESPEIEAARQLLGVKPPETFTDVDELARGVKTYTGMDKGEPLPARSIAELPADHPSRRKNNQEIVA